MIALTATANAADLGSYKGGPASYAAVNWSGFYAGASAGGQSSKAAFNDVVNGTGTVDKGDLNGSGFIGGGQIGYNIQRGNLVFGVESDLGDLDNSVSKKATMQPNNTVLTHSTSGGLYGDITGRVGYAFDKALVYAKGGYAFVNVDDKVSSYTDANNHSNGSVSGTNSGWTLGAGVEYLVTPAWSVKAEYQHFEFADTSISAADGTGSTKFKDATVDAVTAGVNYHIGHGYDILK